MSYHLLCTYEMRENWTIIEMRPTDEVGTRENLPKGVEHYVPDFLRVHAAHLLSL